MDATNVLTRDQAVDTALQMLKHGTSLYNTLEYLRTNILPAGQAKYGCDMHATMLERVEMHKVSDDEAVCEYADFLVEVRATFSPRE